MFVITQRNASWLKGVTTAVIFLAAAHVVAEAPSPASEAGKGGALRSVGPPFTLECATISKGGGVLSDGSIGVIGQPAVGTISNAQFTIDVGIVPCLAAAACPSSSTPVAETLGAISLQSSLEGGTVAVAARIAVNVKNRYVSILAGDSGRNQAIRVRFKTLPTPFDMWEFDNPSRDPLVDGPGDYFVGEPFQVCENGGEVIFSCTGGMCSNPPNNACSTDVDCCGTAGPLPRNWFWAAPLVCDEGAAHFMDWHGECDGATCVGGLLEGDSCATDEDCVDVVHLFHEGFVPDGVYDVQVVASSCSLQEEDSYSTPLTMTQGVWGDICSNGPGGACTGVADGNPEVIQDVLGLIDKFQNINTLQKSRADLVPGDDGEHNGPDFKVTIIGDALFALDAFQGFPYPFTPGDPCGPG